MSLGNHSLLLLNDGTLKAFGYGWYGQLSSGQNYNQFSPTAISNMSDVKQVACGENHTLVLLNNGTVYSCGNNNGGMLGNGGSTQYVLTLIPSLSSVIQVAAGTTSSIFLLSDGTIKVCGVNQYYQMGSYTNGNIFTPTKISPQLSNIKQISCGISHSLLLLNDGTIVGLGKNEYGELGGGLNNQTLSEYKIPNISDVKQIACGGAHSLALLNDGTVLSTGQNRYGQLGLGDKNNRFVFEMVPNLYDIKQIACGSNHSLALLNNGTVMAWGSNDNYNLGDNSTISQSSPTIIQGLSDVKQVAGGNCYSCFLLNDGTVKTCGYGGEGECGNGVSGYTSYNKVPTLISVTNVKSLYNEPILETVIKYINKMEVTPTHLYKENSFSVNVELTDNVTASESANFSQISSSDNGIILKSPDISSNIWKKINTITVQ